MCFCERALDIAIYSSRSVNLFQEQGNSSLDRLEGGTVHTGVYVFDFNC